MKKLIPILVAVFTLSMANAQTNSSLPKDSTTVKQIDKGTNTTVTANAGVDKTICAGNSTSIGGSPTASGGSGTYTYSWSPSTGLSATNVANPTATPNGNTTYTVAVSDGQNTATDQVVVVVNALPNVNISGNTTICIGSLTTLIASGGTMYSWSNAATSAPSNTVAPGTTTTYTVTGSDANGCTNTASKVVTVNANPFINISGSLNLCEGSSTTLTASGGFLYNWSPASTLDNANIANPTATPTITSTYTVTGTDANGCSNSVYVVVAVHSKPTPMASNNGPVCVGNALSLNVGSFINYSWSGPQTYSASTQNPLVSISASSNMSGTYIVTVTNANGCTNTASTVVTVNSPPTANAGSNGTISCTQNVSGFSIGTPAIIGNTYSWSSNPAGFSSTTSNPTVSPTLTTTYTLTTTSSSYCTATSSVVVTVNTTTPVANAGPDGTITCTQNVSGITIGTTVDFGTSYSWSSNPVGYTSTISNPIVNPTVTTTYTVTASNTFTGCSASNSVVVRVDKTIPTANAGIDETIYSSDINGVQIGVTSANSVSYSWSPTTGLSSSTISNPVSKPSLTTTYTVIATDLISGCTASDNIVVNVVKGISLLLSDTISIDTTGISNANHIQLPTLDSCFLNYALPLDSFKIASYTMRNDSVFFTWKFYQNPNTYTLVRGEPKANVKSGNNIVYLKLTCSKARGAAHSNVFVGKANVVLAGINDLQANKIKVFPNPTSNTLNIELPSDMKTTVNIELYTLDSKMVLHQQATNTVNTIDMSNFPQGIYMLKVITNDGTQVMRVVKE